MRYNQEYFVSILHELKYLSRCKKYYHFEGWSDTDCAGVWYFEYKGKLYECCESELTGNSKDGKFELRMEAQRLYPLTPGNVDFLNQNKGKNKS